jgi:hypothetical protein
MTRSDYRIPQTQTHSAGGGRTWGVRISRKARGKCICIHPPKQRQKADILTQRQRGRLVQDKITKQPKLNCRNWECGVLVPVFDNQKLDSGSSDSSGGVSNTSSSTAKEAKATESADMLDVFRDTVPVPMTVPGRRYGPGVKPWFFMG